MWIFLIMLLILEKFIFLKSSGEYFFWGVIPALCINISHSMNKEKNRDMITIETADRPGLLVDIAKVFFKKDMSIFSSRINTLGDKVEDTFEIEGKNKAKISTTKVNGIIKALKEVV